jgi:hypothetical protein
MVGWRQWRHTPNTSWCDCQSYVTLVSTSAVTSKVMLFDLQRGQLATMTATETVPDKI